MNELSWSGIRQTLWPSGAGFYFLLLKGQGSKNCPLIKINHNNMMRSQCHHVQLESPRSKVFGSGSPLESPRGTFTT